MGDDSPRLRYSPIISAERKTVHHEKNRGYSPAGHAGHRKKGATAFFAVAPGICSSAFSLIGNSQVVNPANGILALCLAQNDDAQAGGATLVALLAAAKQAVTILIVPGSSEQE